jgi:hypothetical protein
MTQPAIPNTVRTERVEQIRPYPFVGPFAYSLRCTLCRLEVEHTEEQHDILRHGWVL